MNNNDIDIPIITGSPKFKAGIVNFIKIKFDNGIFIVIYEGKTNEKLEFILLNYAVTLTIILSLSLLPEFR